MGSDIWGVATKRYKSLADVKKDEGRLLHQSSIAYDQVRKGYMMKFYDIVDRIYNNSEDNYFIASDIAIKLCDNCDKAFIASRQNQKFCSDRCGRRYRAKHSNDNNVPKAGVHIPEKRLRQGCEQISSIVPSIVI
ncbi:MAG: hypothetical protein IJK88_10735, partial [Clostridia bacterium]|nr:hypothetical protein [Clostridia bacterium]